MSGLEAFPPTLAAARARIAAVRPADYARSRNAIDGAVTHLAPYITHGFITLPEVLAAVASAHRVGVQHKFVFELGWREYFRHLWQRRGDAILHSLHEGPLPDRDYATVLPPDIRSACTGVPAIDAAVRHLYGTGYLHNHARMWLASYVVHLRKAHWRTGADWMYGHLLDGDLASNHLSWQWVAGTASRKPYLFNADNVARYAPADWHSPGTLIDSSYAALDVIARSPASAPVQPAGDGVDEPALCAAPPSAPQPLEAQRPDAAAVAGRDVWLVHPWALREPPQDLPANTLRVGFCAAEFHRAWPWSAARWGFVGTRMAALAPLTWFADAHILAQALRGARSVHTVADPHVQPYLPTGATCRPAAQLFADVQRQCASFSQWWMRATRGVQRVQDLPGLASTAAGPLFEAIDNPDPESHPGKSTDEPNAEPSLPPAVGPGRPGDRSPRWHRP